MDYSLALHVWDLRGKYAGVNVDKVEEKNCPSSTLVRDQFKRRPASPEKLPQG
jgi:hypothetical protein